MPDTPPGPPWIAVLSEAELPPGAVCEAMAGDTIVAVANVEGTLYAFDGLCAHQGGPLGKGRLEGCTLTCPWHGWQYDVPTGRQLVSERIRLRGYPVRIEGGTIWVRIDNA